MSEIVNELVYPNRKVDISPLRLEAMEANVEGRDVWIGAISLANEGVEGDFYAFAEGGSREEVLAMAAYELSRVAMQTLIDLKGKAALVDVFTEVAKMNLSEFEGTLTEAQQKGAMDRIYGYMEATAKPPEYTAPAWGVPQDTPLTLKEALESEIEAMDRTEGACCLPSIAQARKFIEEQKAKPTHALPVPPNFWCWLENDIGIVDFMTGEIVWEAPHGAVFEDIPDRKAYTIFVVEV